MTLEDKEQYFIGNKYTWYEEEDIKQTIKEILRRSHMSEGINVIPVSVIEEAVGKGLMPDKELKA